MSNENELAETHNNEEYRPLSDAQREAGFVQEDESIETRDTHPHLEFETRSMKSPDITPRIITMLSPLWRVWDIVISRANFTTSQGSDFINDMAHDGDMTFEEALRIFCITMLKDMIEETTSQYIPYTKPVNIYLAYRLPF